MQKRFPSLSFCVGIAFGKRRAEAVVVWRAARWCAGVCGEVVCGAVWRLLKQRCVSKSREIVEKALDKAGWV